MKSTWSDSEFDSHSKKGETIALHVGCTNRIDILQDELKSQSWEVGRTELIEKIKDLEELENAHEKFEKFSIGSYLASKMLDRGSYTTTRAG